MGVVEDQVGVVDHQANVTVHQVCAADCLVAEVAVHLRSLLLTDGVSFSSFT